MWVRVPKGPCCQYSPHPNDGHWQFATRGSMTALCQESRSGKGLSVAVVINATKWGEIDPKIGGFLSGNGRTGRFGGVV